MAPIRRYLKISKYSVLECRIYLDNPALAHSWLLNPRNPILPRVIASVRPLVLPKLREERERSRKKSTKKRGIKDIVVEDDFEVSIFLTETSTRHSLLYKHKHFRDKTQTKLTSNSTKLTGASRELPINVEEPAEDAEQVTVVREEGDDDAMALFDIPTMDEGETITAPVGSPPLMRPSKRRRGRGAGLPRDDDDDDDDGAEHDAEILISDEEEGDDDNLFVDDEDSDGSATAPPPAKRRKDGASPAEHEALRDDKKKLAMDISYEGFSIYGRVLCLVVKRRDGHSAGRNAPAKAGRRSGQSAAPGGGQAVMENWITSTQMPEVAPDEIPGAS
ncbi:hypothetical protein N8I77_011710 [Diaporthe amygdali]|uniref:Uncharacterized protein n=1 Tax=Phomopsis amygdali TaxID=1214568 RepID=A0AAD9VXI1_PHOAM|nr:hypothetical protein N8I77_011710 [Diaporthe amygdali]